MKWRLGIDLGTNSMGWAALGLDKQGEVEGLTGLGVRIFSDGRDPKSGEPLNAERRLARGVRKNIRRRKQRRRVLFRLLREQGLFPAPAEEAVDLKKYDPYALRAKALDDRLEPYELGRSLFHLGVRRGFKSNRKDQGDEALPETADETGQEKKETNRDIQKMKQGEKCLVLKADMAASGFRTIGEFLFHQNTIDPKTNKAHGVRFSPGRFPWYPLRELYEQEFDAIKEKQASYYPDIAWDEIRTAIFYQRPLKKQERGKCQFMPEYERTFKAMPSSIRIRILQEVYNLKFYDKSNNYKKIALTDAERDTVIRVLDESKKEVTFTTLKKKLKTQYDFNSESEIRTGLKGNETGSVLRGERYFGALWDTLSLPEQDDIVEMLIEEDEYAAVIAVLGKYSLTDAQKRTIARYAPSFGTTSLCKQLTQQVVAVMEQERCGYVEALDKMGIKHSDEQVEKFDEVPYYGKVLSGSVIGGDEKYGEDTPEKKYGKIANPTVHVALNQTAKVVNALIKKYGKPAQIVIELSRKLKMSREDKDEARRKQTVNAKRNIILNKKITDTTGMPYPNRADRLKYRLWEELGANELSRRCLYCGKIIRASELFTGNIEVDHILPFSKTLLDAESNLTVVHTECNKEKKNLSPYGAFSSSPGDYNWEEIAARAKQLPNKIKAKRFSPDAMEVYEKENNFIARQLTDNAYLSKMSRKYLKTVCDDVWVVSGRMTKILRDKWRIDSILKSKITEREITHFNLKPEQIGSFKKNRYDHRHHALDAMVIALTDRARVQYIATLNALSLGDRIKVPSLPLLHSDIVDKTRNIIVSFKPDHGAEGKLSKETALGRIKQETLIPTGELTLDDIPNIKDRNIRAEFEEALVKENGDLKAVVKKLRETHPKLRVFRYCFVARTPVTSLLSEKNIDDIIDPVIQKRLRDFINLHKNEALKDVLVRFSENTGIKRLRCKTYQQATIPPIPPKTGKPLSETRYYNPLDYFTAIIWEIPPAKGGEKPRYQAQFVRRIRAEIDEKGRPIRKKPHPAAREVCVLFKDDYVEFSENGVWKKARINKYQDTTNGGLDIRPIYAADDMQSWIIATSEQALEEGWKPQPNANYISVNKLFGDYSARKITVSPIGEVHRSRLH